MKNKQYKQMLALATAGISLGLVILNASFNNLIQTAPAQATGKTEKNYNSSMVVAQGAKLNPNEILQTHNKYRQEISLPALAWSNDLAKSAQNWANKLAAASQFKHSKPNGAYGENIGMGKSGYTSPKQIVELWGSEKQHFIPGRAFPDLSKTGNWKDVGHYTQVIWKNTKSVGCGVASSGDNEYFVCHYHPPGNYRGQKPY